MAQRTVAIGARSGLHARPATLFVRAAAAAPVPVRISVAGRPSVDARSMLGVLSLGAAQRRRGHAGGAGEQADEALDRLAALLARDLDADGCR